MCVSLRLPHQILFLGLSVCLESGRGDKLPITVRNYIQNLLKVIVVVYNTLLVFHFVETSTRALENCPPPFFAFSIYSNIAYSS